MTDNTQTVSPDGFASALNKILERFDLQNIESADLVMRETTKNMFGSIIEDTPVGDFDPAHAGTLKGGWEITTGSAYSGLTGRMTPRRTRKGLRIPRLITKQGSKDIYLTNNVPYINVAEYGGYKKNPKLGTLDKRTGRYVIRSKGGFSKQAPKGMVRKNMAKAGHFLTEAANKVLKG